MTARSALARAILKENPGRTRLMVAAIAVGAGAVGAILGAFTVIDRTITDSFASTSPADATLVFSKDVSADAALALTVPGVTAAEARREVTVRDASADGWQPLTLVSVGDLDAWRIGTATPQDGAWPPATGQIVIERASVKEVDIEVGDTMSVASPGGASTLTVVGLAHDAGRTPAWMNGQVIGYATPETLATLGVEGGLSELAIRTDPTLSRDDNRHIADDVAAAFSSRGYAVTDVVVPVPGEHPAAGVMNTLLYLLQAFGIVAFVAAIALVTTLMVAEVKRSSGRIAVMKTGGATSRQVTGVYVSAVAWVAVGGVIFGVIGGMAGTWALSTFALTLLNLDATSMIASWWVFPLQAVVALGVPLAAVSIPIRRLSSLPVRQGIVTGATAPARTPRSTRVEPHAGRAIAMGVRNALRQPGRLALTTASLAVGAAAVMAALNTGAAWDRIVGDEFSAARFDVQVSLTAPVSIGSLDDAAADAGLSRIEYWNAARASVTGPDGHVGDAALVLSAPSDSTSAAFPVIDGRRLRSSDEHAVVISQSLTDPSVGVGDTIMLEGDASSWTVVGVVRQLSGGQEGAVWLSQPLASMGSGTATVVRVTGTDEGQALEAIQEVVADAGIGIADATTATAAKQSLDDHLFIITGLLLVMSIGLGIVGLLGLVEAMSTAVAERRGEIAVMKTVGASTTDVMRMVVTEALVVTGLGVAGGIAIASGLTALVETAVGVIFTGAALPYTWWLPGVAITALAMAGAGAASSIVPAYEAADLPVREALARG